MAVSKPESSPTKFVREFYTYDYETRTKKLDSRWHYDLSITTNGPILTEEFNLPRKERTQRKKKVGKK